MATTKVAIGDGFNLDLIVGPSDANATATTRCDRLRACAAARGLQPVWPSSPTHWWRRPCSTADEPCLARNIDGFLGGEW